MKKTIFSFAIVACAMFAVCSCGKSANTSVVEGDTISVDTTNVVDTIEVDTFACDSFECLD